MQREITTSGREGDARGVRTWLLIGGGAVSLASLGALAYLAAGNDHLSGELSASLWIQSWRTSWLDAIMKAVSEPGFRVISWPLLGLTTAVLYVRGQRRASGLILAVTVLAMGINVAIGQLVDRPRPSADLVHTFGELRGVSFPSGHVVFYVVFFGTLALGSTQGMKPGLARSLTIGGLFLWLVSIGISRIYLGAHWLVDVLGGYALGTAVVAGALALWRHDKP